MKAALLSLLLFVPSAFALRAVDLVPDAEKLYAQLPTNDPQHRAVALRLADLLYDASVELFGDSAATPAQMAKVETLRHRSLKIYEENLPTLKGATALRVKFQISRLLSDLGQAGRAQALWRELSRQHDDRHIQRESALHLAEQLELSNSHDAIREAGQLYALALPLAAKENMRSYILFRQSWTQYRLGDVRHAVENLRLSLRMADERSRGEMVRDLVLFLSRSEFSARESMAILVDYEKQLKRTDLIRSLADAYLAADRRMEYSEVLAYENRMHPTLERSVASLDVRHDQLSVPELQKELKQLVELKQSGIDFSDAKAEKTSNDAYIRLLMLWDGQRRAHKPEFGALFTAGVEDSLILFPRREETLKAVSGWLAATPDAHERFTYLDRWIPLAQAAKNPPLELALRRTKLEVARELKDWPAVVAESQYVEANTKGVEARAARYQRAKAYYELKNSAAALPLFQAIADETGKAPDDLVRYSQDLTLSILAEQKNYPAVVEASSRWGQGTVRHQELAAIGEKARFEQAAQQKDAASLKEFSRFCFSGKFLPKSCENAKALAVELKDQPTLIAVLKTQGDEKELARQLEISGQFADSARLQEKHLAKDDLLGALKVAMLYELQGDDKDRDRLLKAQSTRLAHSKSALPNEQQYLFYQTLSDAGLMDASALQLPFSEELKRKITSELYERKPTPVLAKALLATCEGGGAGWASAHVAQLKELYRKENGIQFLGSHGKTKFTARVDALKKFAEGADCFRKGSGDPEARATAALKVGHAYTEFTEQIRSAPIPEGLDESTLAQVKEQIETMSEPFDTLATKWNEVAESDLNQVSETERVAASERAHAEEWPKASPAPVVTASATNFDWKSELAEVQREPFSKPPLEKLKAHFEQSGNKRLAAYIGGRLQGLEQQ